MTYLLIPLLVTLSITGLLAFVMLSGSTHHAEGEVERLCKEGMRK